MEQSTETSHPHSSEAAPLELTAKAIEMAKNAISKDGLQGWGLRVGVVGGGCSGFSYNLNFEEKAKADDTVLTLDGLEVFVDETSMPYLRGMTIDYVSGLHGAGFKFLNPNATRTCGCGSSFAV